MSSNNKSRLSPPFSSHFGEKAYFFQEKIFELQQLIIQPLYLDLLYTFFGYIPIVNLILTVIISWAKWTRNDIFVVVGRIAN